MRSEFCGDFNQVSVGDIIMLDKTVHIDRKEGGLLHVFQGGNQNDRADFETYQEEMSTKISKLGFLKFAITRFYPDEEMRSNRDLRDEGRDAEYGQFIGQEVTEENDPEYVFAQSGLLISFNQGPNDSRGGFDVFERTFNFPEPRLGTVQFEVVKKIIGFTPA